ncbi:MAG: glycosyltransferase [Gemmataceae bacterium]
MNLPPAILTINLEDYFHVGSFHEVIPTKAWSRFESRLDQQVDHLLAMLAEHKARATFFVLGWIAEQYPDLVFRIREAGHEIASRGYTHHDIRKLPANELIAELRRARSILEEAAQAPVLGYRMSHGWADPRSTELFDLLLKEGYAYDSSVAPIGISHRGRSGERRLFRHTGPDGSLTVLPISSMNVSGMNIPIGGGNWVRQFPFWMMKRAARKWTEQYAEPLVLYFHSWEFDEEQPQIQSVGWLTRLRHYRRIENMSTILRHYLASFQCQSAADFLRLSELNYPQAPRMTTTPAPVRMLSLTRPLPEAKPVSIVVPLYNEKDSLHYLFQSLDQLRVALQPAYRCQFVLVDDASTDDTLAQVEEFASQQTDVQVCRHPVNQGVAGAIRTGVEAATTEIVCSIDADCTYDPLILQPMIALLKEDVQLVLASPYHPEGHVANVPGWRLWLSRGASWCYRRILKNKLYSYTSCVRVYRRSAFAGMPLESTRFLGVVEWVVRADQQGHRIVEHPATLTARLFGISKMKTVHTILGHLGMLWRAGVKKQYRQPKSAPVLQPVQPPSSVSSPSGYHDQHV